MDNKKGRGSAGGKRTGSGGAYGKKPGGAGSKPQGRFGKPSGGGKAGGKPGGGKSFGGKPRAAGKPKFRSEGGGYGDSEGGSYKRTGSADRTRKFEGEGGDRKPYARSAGKYGASGSSGTGAGRKPYGRTSEGGYEGRSSRGRSEEGGYEERSPRGRSSEGGYDGRASKPRSGYEERKSREGGYGARTGSSDRAGGGERYGRREGGYDAERPPRTRVSRDERADRGDRENLDPNLVFLKMNISKDLVQRAKELAADNEMSLTDFLPKLFEVAVNSLERAAYRKRTYVTEAASQNRKSIKTWRPKEE